MDELIALLEADAAVHQRHGSENSTSLNTAHLLTRAIDRIRRYERMLAEQLDAFRAALPGNCDGKEQEAFEAWAQSEEMDMQVHPLHYLFLDRRTDAARRAWNECIRYCRSQVEARPPVDRTSVTMLDKLREAAALAAADRESRTGINPGELMAAIDFSALDRAISAGVLTSRNAASYLAKALHEAEDRVKGLEARS